MLVPSILVFLSRIELKYLVFWSSVLTVFVFWSMSGSTSFCCCISSNWSIFLRVAYYGNSTSRSTLARSGCFFFWVSSSYLSLICLSTRMRSLSSNTYSEKRSSIFSWINLFKSSSESAVQAYLFLNLRMIRFFSWSLFYTRLTNKFYCDPVNYPASFVNEPLNAFGLALCVNGPVYDPLMVKGPLMKGGGCFDGA